MNEDMEVLMSTGNSSVSCVHSCMLICLLMFFIDKVVLETVTGVRGGNVVLPCTHKASVHRDDMTVYWRFYEKKNVYDIISGSASLSLQEPEFRGRTETFPEEYTNGNFSLLLKNVDLIDGGVYTCFIPPRSAEFQIELQVTDKLSIKNSSMKTGPVSALVLILLFR